MLLPPPIMMKLAREFLGLSQEMVEAHSGVSRSSIQRVERGMAVMLNSVAELTKFYTRNGIVFLPPENGRGWGVVNNNFVQEDSPLNHLPSVELRKRSTPKVE
ncbi:helix-turn-helix transcriptional regulator [Rhizobium bangladeshense]|nr:helix-turn-helix transcriptional regulator [Rhizobium bangladeshense]